MQKYIVSKFIDLFFDEFSFIEAWIIVCTLISGIDNERNWISNFHRISNWLTGFISSWLIKIIIYKLNNPIKDLKDVP